MFQRRAQHLLKAETMVCFQVVEDALARQLQTLACPPAIQLDGIGGALGPRGPPRFRVPHLRFDRLAFPTTRHGSIVTYPEEPIKVLVLGHTKSARLTA